MWDLSNPDNVPEEFASQLAMDLGEDPSIAMKIAR
jgi:hypothetical protein